MIMTFLAVIKLFDWKRLATTKEIVNATGSTEDAGDTFQARAVLPTIAV